MVVTLARGGGGSGSSSAASSSRSASAGSHARGGELVATEAARPAPRARRALALLGRLRRDRLVDLLRARRPRRCTRSASRRSCCSASGCSSCSSRSRTPRRRRRSRRRAAPRRSSAARYNDLAGFLTGWALFLDYLIVIALSALFVPHYLAGAFQVPALDQNPWDVVVGVGVIVVVAGVRLVRRPSLYAARDRRPRARRGHPAGARRLRLRLRLLAARADARHVARPRSRPGTRSPSRCRSRCSRSPGSRRSRTWPRRPAGPASTCRARCSSRSRTVVTVYVAIAVVALSAFPGPNTELGTRWLRSPLVGHRRQDPARAADAARRHPPLLRRRERRADPARRGDDVDLRASRASPTRSASTGSCRERSGGCNRRTLVSPQAILAAALISAGSSIATSFIKHDVAFLASVFSFGVLLAFTAAQLAVIKLRVAEPDLPRPYRAPFNVTIRGAAIPLPAIVGSIADVRDLDHRAGDAPGRALRRARSGSRSASSSTSPCAARTASRSRPPHRARRAPAAARRPSSGGSSCR